MYPSHIVLLLAFFAFCAASAQEPVDLVDPFSGTSHGGNTFPGAVVPWGLVSVSPHNDLSNPSGYYSGGNDSLHGFGHVHTSGTGCLALGHITVMPTAGEERVSGPYAMSAVSSRYASAGYFRCRVDKHAVVAEVTASERVGFHRYRYGRNGARANILIDVTKGIGETMGGFVQVNGDGEIEGWNLSGNFCSSPNAFRIYFVARFQRRPRSVQLWRDGELLDTDTASGMSVGACAEFNLRTDEEILLKVAISYTSVAGARANLDAEIPAWDFDAVHEAARERWRTELGRIDVRGGTLSQRRTFYTALYHSLIHPNLVSDVSGENPAYNSDSDRQVNDQVVGWDTLPHYTLFALWDTHRSLHPLLSLVWPERQRAMMVSLVDAWRSAGRLPKWEIAATETWSMVGDPAAIALADAWYRGIDIGDPRDALAATLATGDDPSVENWYRPGIVSLLRYRYLPVDDIVTYWWVGSAVSQALEFAEADAAIAQLARAACDDETSERYADRAMWYANNFDRATGFFRPRTASGEWVDPFDPNLPDSQIWCEGNAWHYRFYAPHDVPHLIVLHGGDDSFTQRVQAFFDSSYFAWNEHSFLWPYLFTWVPEQAWRTQREVASLVAEMTIGNGGIPSNDDAGAISSWYVWSTIGLYPSFDGYRIGRPLFDTVFIRPTSSAAPITIIARQRTRQSNFIAAASLNGRALYRPELRPAELSPGATLKFEMVPDPIQWGAPLLPPRITALHPDSVDPTFRIVRWLPVAGAISYRVQASTGAAFCSPEIDEIVPASSLAARISMTGSKGWWRVGAVDTLGAEVWSRAHPSVVTLGSSAETDERRSMEVVATGSSGRSYRLVHAISRRSASNVTVVDVLGQLVARLPVFPSAGRVTVNVGDVSPGPYLVTVTSSAGSELRTLIVY